MVAMFQHQAQEMPVDQYAIESLLGTLRMEDHILLVIS